MPKPFTEDEFMAAVGDALKDKEAVPAKAAAVEFVDQVVPLVVVSAYAGISRVAPAPAVPELGADGLPCRPLGERVARRKCVGPGRW